jgi:hypothetical protein
MTNEEFDKHVGSFFDFIASIGKTKGREYSGAIDGKDDRLANFKRLAVKLGVTPETVCLIYGTKHLDAIDTFVKTLQKTGKIPVQLSEPIEGRFHDAVLYLILLSAIVAERAGVEAQASRIVGVSSTSSEIFPP